MSKTATGLLDRDLRSLSTVVHVVLPDSKGKSLGRLYHEMDDHIG